MNDISQAIADKPEAESTYKEMPWREEKELEVSPESALVVLPEHPRENVKVYSGRSCCVNVSPTEQSRLLNEVPEVIPGEADAGPSYKDMLRLNEEHHVSPESALVATPEHLRQSSKLHRNSCRRSDGADVEGLLRFLSYLSYL